MNRFVNMLNAKNMTLIMSLPKNDEHLCEAAFKAGADVVKVHCNLEHRASKQGFLAFESYTDIFKRMLLNAAGPMGLVLGTKIADILRDMESAAALSFDFFSLYAHHVPPALLSMPQALMAASGYDYAMDEVAQLAATGAKVLEASIIPPEGYGELLSLRDILAYRRFCQATELPVVVPTQRKISPGDLPYLRDAGVKGVMIGAIVTGNEPEGILRQIAAFRNAIDKL